MKLGAEVRLATILFALWVVACCVLLYATRPAACFEGGETPRHCFD